VQRRKSVEKYASYSLPHLAFTKCTGFFDSLLIGAQQDNPAIIRIMNKYKSQRAVDRDEAEDLIYLVFDRCHFLKIKAKEVFQHLDDFSEDEWSQYYKKATKYILLSRSLESTSKEDSESSAGSDGPLTLVDCNNPIEATAGKLSGMGDSLLSSFNSAKTSLDALFKFPISSSDQSRVEKSFDESRAEKMKVIANFILRMVHEDGCKDQGHSAFAFALINPQDSMFQRAHEVLSLSNKLPDPAKEPVELKELINKIVPVFTINK
jgi:hypothetical protein